MAMGALECLNLVDGERTKGGQRVERRNPSDTGEVVSIAFHATASDVDAAVAAARKALPAWARLVPQARADLLDKIASLILARREELAVLLSREEGKTLPESRAEITKSSHLFKFYAGEAVRLTGDHVRSVREGIDIANPWVSRYSSRPGISRSRFLPGNWRRRWPTAIARS